ncbi:MAG: transglutaminase domain-containing protein, partial [Planctomycetota bacterium]
MAKLLVAVLSVSCQEAPAPQPRPGTASPGDAGGDTHPAAAPRDATPAPPAPVAAGAPEADAGTPPPPAAEGELVLDEWTLIMMSGQPAGRASLRVVRRGEEFLTSVEQSFQMSRMGVVIKAGTTASVREGVGGDLVGFEMDMDVAANNVRIEGRVEGAKLVLTSRTMGRERTRTLEWPEGALFGYAEERFVRSQELKAGAKFSYWTYVPDLEKVAEMTYEVGDTEEIDVLGRKVRATRMVKTGAAVPIVEYRDADGIAWKMQMSMAGISMEMLRTSREVALGRTARPGSFDVLTDLAVRVGPEIEYPRAVTEATYRMRLAADALDDLDLDGPGQRATREEDGIVLLEVKAVRPRGSAPLGSASARADMKEYLQASTFAQSDDPAVVSVARRVTRGARTSLDAAKRLERWVAKNVAAKGFGTGFATASEVMQDRAGDCSEHAVLLCA